MLLTLCPISENVRCRNSKQKVPNIKDWNEKGENTTSQEGLERDVVTFECFKLKEKNLNKSKMMD